MISRVNSIREGYGSVYLLQAILVCVLGGVDPSGGSGSISGLIMGIITLQVLQSGFNILSFSPFFKKVIWGLILILVMVINFYSAMLSQKSIKRLKTN
jgi:simple sugar transport system permease protein